jgi:hypothetical protein
MTDKVVAKKKGFKTWRPASMLAIRDRDENFTYRWANKEPLNQSKKLAEGWEYLPKTSGETPVSEDGRHLDLREYKSLILMRMPNEIKEARTKYYDDMTDRQCVHPKKRVPTLAREEENITDPQIIENAFYDPAVKSTLI